MLSLSLIFSAAPYQIKIKNATVSMNFGSGTRVDLERWGP
jgi:hypothetical protein